MPSNSDNKFTQITNLLAPNLAQLASFNIKNAKLSSGNTLQSPITNILGFTNNLVPTSNRNNPISYDEDDDVGGGSSSCLNNRMNNRNQFNHDNYDDDDGDGRALKLVCQDLNNHDSEKILFSVILIQRAFRKYQICKRFRMITEQLRYTSQANNTSPSVNDSVNSSNNQDHDETIERKNFDNNNTSDITYASGTTRAAALESLRYAASRIAANTLANQARQQQEQQQQQEKRQPLLDQKPSNLLSILRQGAGASSLTRRQASCKSSDSIANAGEEKSLAHARSSSNDMLCLENNNYNNFRHLRHVGPKVNSKSSDPTLVTSNAPNYKQLEALRKRQYRVGLNIFNKSPEKGISFFIAYSFIDCSSTRTKSSTSYYLSNQLHLIDKQNLAQQQTICQQKNCQQQQQQLACEETINNQHNYPRGANCQMCVEEENLKRNIAHFLLHRKGLAKERVGQYLGNLQSQFNQDVLRYYLQEMDFSGLQIDIALRKFSSTVRMPGEAQKIERFLDYFAERYFQCQQQQLIPSLFGTNLDQQNWENSLRAASKVCSTAPGEENTRHQQQRQQQQQQKQQQHPPMIDSNSSKTNTNISKSNLTLLSRDEIFILTFAIIMLNTDLHSPSLKSTSRMSGRQFINNLRGVFKSQSINESDLLAIYERVKANQITSASDHFTHVTKVQQGLTTNNFQKKDTIPNLCIPHRRLVCFCRLFEVYDINKKERGGQHQREVFLFNDMLLVTKLARRTRANGLQQYTYRQSVPLLGLQVQLFQSAHYNFGIRLSQRSNDETLIMFNAGYELDQRRFVDDLRESVAETEEMEVIKAHDVVETIYHRHQECLKRHAMIHETQMNVDDVNHPNHLDTDDKKLSKDLPTNFTVKERSSSEERLALLDVASDGSSEAENKQPVSSKGSKSKRLQSKFSSMSDLSSVSEGRDDEELKSVSPPANFATTTNANPTRLSATRINQPFMRSIRNLIF